MFVSLYSISLHEPSKQVLCYPLGAKTWIGRSEIFGLIFFSFDYFYTFFSLENLKKKKKKKPTVNFKILGSVAKGNATSLKKKSLIAPDVQLQNVYRKKYR